jgi:hypothetical protein
MKSSEFPAFTRELASRYLKASFDPTDRLAVVLVNRPADSVIQRIATAETIASTDFQTWLRYHNNAEHYEIYVSMNALHPAAKGRTKADVAVIRHVYLDFDENGTSAVQALFKREDLPVPSHVVNTSPNKWQVSWRVDGFTKDASEHLQRGLSRETGADLAATDCARVLRLPGFYNHKYDRPYLIRVEPHAALSGAIYRPDQFPTFPADGREVRTILGTDPSRSNRARASGPFSQSERDWAFAKRALARGEAEETVIAAIASYRRYDKHNPMYYAEHTVRKAAQSVAAEKDSPFIGHDRI